MDHFTFKGSKAYCEDVSVEDIAREVGTPTYVYSKSTLVRHLGAIKDAFSSYPTLPCFAVKANSNINMLKEIFSHGFGGDLVSLGELKRAEMAGVDPKKVVFSGVGKRPDEIAAAMEFGILSFNVESEFELHMIRDIAKQKGLQAPICLRINPNIDAKTNPKITTGMFSTKFGIVEDEAYNLAEMIKNDPNLQLIGLACHIGSQITDLKPLEEAALRMSDMCLRLKERGHQLKVLNMGGGLGIRYKDEIPPEPSAYGATLISAVKKTGLQLIIEPGRVLMGNVGVLLCQVVGMKKTPSKTFVVVDGAMNDLIRPSMYDSFHEIVLSDRDGGETGVVDVVGPICESGDYFAKDREMVVPKQGELLMVRGCGAYASTMASNYNSRPRAAEVLVDGTEYREIKRRETMDQLWQGEI